MPSCGRIPMRSEAPQDPSWPVNNPSCGDAPHRFRHDDHTPAPLIRRVPTMSISSSSRLPQWSIEGI